MAVGSGYDVATAPFGADEVNTVTSHATTPATGGTWTLTVNGQTTGTIAFDANAAAVQSALEALSNVAPGDVTAVDSGGGVDLGDANHVVTLTWGGAFSGTNVTITADFTNLVGNVHAFATTTAGGGTGLLKIKGNCGGATPKGVAVFFTRVPVGSTLVDGAMISAGFSDGTTHVAGATMSETAAGVATFNTGRRSDGTALGIALATTSEAQDGLFTFSSFSADSVTINITDAASTALIIVVWFFYGDEMQVKVGQLALAASVNGTATASGLGFRPRGLLTAGVIAGSGIHSRISLGCCTFDNDSGGTIRQLCWGFVDRDTPTTITRVRQTIRDDSCLSRSLVLDNGNLSEESWYDVTQQDAGGFVVTTRNEANGLTMNYFAFRPGDSRAWCGIPGIATNTTGDKAVTAPGWRARFVAAWASAQATKNTFIDTQGADAGTVGIGAADEVGGDKCCHYQTEAGASTSDTRSNTRSKLFSVVDDDATIITEGTLASFDAQGFTVNIGTASGATKVIGFLAVEESTKVASAKTRGIANVKGTASILKPAVGQVRGSAQATGTAAAVRVAAGKTFGSSQSRAIAAAVRSASGKVRGAAIARGTAAAGRVASGRASGSSRAHGSATVVQGVQTAQGRSFGSSLVRASATTTKTVHGRSFGSSRARGVATVLSPSQTVQGRSFGSSRCRAIAQKIVTVCLGVPTPLDVRLVPKVLQILQRLGRKVTFVTTTKSYSAATGLTTFVETPVIVQSSPLLQYDLGLVDGEIVQVGDCQLLVPKKNLTFVPLNAQTVRADGSDWQIVSVETVRSGEEHAVYILQLRGGEPPIVSSTTVQSTLDGRLPQRVKVLIEKYGKKTLFTVVDLKQYNPATALDPEISKSQFCEKMVLDKDVLILKNRDVAQSQKAVGYLFAHQLPFVPHVAMNVDFEDQTWDCERVTPISTGGKIGCWQLDLAR